MTWLKESVMEQKTKFIQEAMAKQESFKSICEKYNISRKIGYKYVQRFLQFGLPGLEEMSRKPHSTPLQLPEEVICNIINLKIRKPHWGAKKLRVIYSNENPDAYIPSLSSFERVLKKSGLTSPRKRKRKPSGIRIITRYEVDKPNDLWTVDFKGHWFTTKRERVNPLTIRDDYSKYLLAVDVVEKGDTENVKRVFERVFKKYGLPKVIKSDNGTPFANVNNELGLTKLSVWWMSLGIKLHRIKPGKPSENGGHERMHLDIAKEIENLRFKNLSSYKNVIDEWVNEFNFERPHQSINMKTPSSVYEKSEVPYYEHLENFTYTDEYYPRKVSNRGQLRFDGDGYFIGSPFAGYVLGVDTNNDQLKIYFGNSLLGHLSKKEKRLIPITMD